MRVKKAKGRLKVQNIGSIYDLSTHELVDRLKLLKTQAATYQRNIERLKKDQSENGKEISEVKNLLRTRRGYEVTDHAVVRYLERVKGFDVEGLRGRVSDYAKSNPEKCFVSDEGLLVTVYGEVRE